MANRKATFAKRQREADLKDRAKQKEDRRTQKRTEVRESKGPQIAWDEAVHAVTSDDELPPLDSGPRDEEDGGDEADDTSDVDDAPTPPASSLTSVNTSSGATPKSIAAPAKTGPVSAQPKASTGPASPRGVG